jgi:hypothetical protein
MIVMETAGSHEAHDEISIERSKNLRSSTSFSLIDPFKDNLLFVDHRLQ